MARHPVSRHRTTPDGLRVPGLILLLVMLAYQGLAFRYARAPYDTWPAWLQEHSFSLWPATWKMFTSRERRQRDMSARALRAGAWEEIELLPVFPARWESGPRYIRKPFWRDTAYRNTMAQALCRRLEEQPEAVELWLVEWDKTLGQVEQPRDTAKHSLLTRWSCDDHQPLPTGRRI